MNKNNIDIEELQEEIKSLKKQLGIGVFKLSEEGQEYISEVSTCNFTIQLENFSILDFAATIHLLAEGNTCEGKYSDDGKYVIFNCNKVYLPAEFLEEV